MCVYGCGQEAKYQLNNGKWCCESKYSKCKINRLKNAKLRIGYKYKNVQCVYCNKIRTIVGIKKHQNSCKLNPDNIAKLEERKKCLDYVCENCGNKHNGMFGSGRFCSDKCCKSFATNNQIQWTKTFQCTKCGNNIIRSKHASLKNKIICNNCKILNNKSRNSKEYKQKFSEIIKKTYITGKKKQSGGKTKWYDYIRIDTEKIRVQGTYELRLCYILDKWKKLKIIQDWQYGKDRYKYIGLDNLEHTYLIDFKIINFDNSYYYFETKGFIRPNDYCKWKAVRDKNIILYVLYNHDLKDYENELFNCISL